MRLRYWPLANSNWDLYTGDPEWQPKIKDELSAIGTYDGYWDSKLSWGPSAFVYCDSHAIYVGGPVAKAHPEWILKDSRGNPLYISWGNRPYTQYAADIGHPGFRQYIIDAMKAEWVKGYKGIFFDDVNLSMNLVNANGDPATPFDPRTRRNMTQDQWSSYFVAYLENLRAAMPLAMDILHNSVWFSSANPAHVRRQIQSANYINIERGYGDPGLSQGGNGYWSVWNLMKFIDQVHDTGTSVVIEDYDVANRSFSLACYYLTLGVNDAFGISNETPNLWIPALYAANLGAPKAGREMLSVAPGQYVWARRFDNGIALVNEIGAQPVTIQLDGTATDPAIGIPSNTVTLAPKTGGIYIYS